jgi:formate dehydrogenase assembly factor FdhD
MLAPMHSEAKDGSGAAAEVGARRMYERIEHDGVTDEVALEEPLEIRVDGQALAVTMRTPGGRSGSSTARA